ncbi:MAG: hypothetical protein ACRCXT_19480, partial [Paraclostridium sp.]
AIIQYKQSDDNNKIKNHGSHLIENNLLINKRYLLGLVGEQWLTPSKLSKILKSIMEKGEFQLPSGESVCIISDLYLLDKNHISVEFCSNFNEYFHCSRNFTQLPLQAFYMYKSKNAMKILELIFMYKSIGKINIGLQEFKFLLSRDNSQIGDFNKDLRRAKAYIESSSDKEFIFINQTADKCRYIITFPRHGIKTKTV